MIGSLSHRRCRSNRQTFRYGHCRHGPPDFNRENSLIQLSKTDGDSFTRNASFWRILSSPRPGHVLYLKRELTQSRWRIYGDNAAMARRLQFSVVGGINAELLDLTSPTTDARFNKSGNMRDFS
jgi:hypothetical protein